ncbi:MAG: hypothetical protein QOJ65_2299 [Fimbriimonadaceae bacterium]|jgi:hypothetical protein|nr:hypothetical protein [Fimbriimonadaceae bacterium]
MPIDNLKIALLWHGDREARDSVRLEDHRLAATAAALKAVGLEPEAAVYNDDFVNEVKAQLLAVAGVLVWVNPIEQGRDRIKLDTMLGEVASQGVFVSAHPSTIQKMGTKEVLHRTKGMSWGSDVHLYRSVEELRNQLPGRLAEGKPRVLKRHRGHSGNGVWKITPNAADKDRIRVRHAARGSLEEELQLEDFLSNAETLFPGGPIIDQEYQDRLSDGMVRCYLVRDQVAGFGHQEVNALYPPPAGGSPEDAPQPGPRLYHPPSKPEFQAIKHRMEKEWVPEMLSVLGMQVEELPLLWDADFMLGQKSDLGEDTYVLCEINVSSVYPYPESALEPLAIATRDRLLAAVISDQ